MDTDQTRRMFLGQAGASLGLLWLSSLTPDLLAQAHAHAQVAGKTGAKTYRFFTPQQAAEFDAFSAQIIPTDDTPGAREANVVHFTDYVLSTIDSDQQAQVKDALQGAARAGREDCSGSDVLRGAHFRAADRGHEGDGENGRPSAFFADSR